MSKPRWQHIDYHIYDPNAPGERSLKSIEPDLITAVNQFIDKFPDSPFRVIEHGYRHILPTPVRFVHKELKK